MKLNRVRYADLMVVACEQSLAWHKANSPHLTEQQANAYAAGFDAGWRALVTELERNRENDQ